MKKAEKLLTKLRTGTLRSWKFGDAQLLIEHLGFRHIRTTGSHHIYRHQQTKEIHNLQTAKNGEAKPYQLRQLKNWQANQ